MSLRPLAALLAVLGGWALVTMFGSARTAEPDLSLADLKSAHRRPSALPEAARAMLTPERVRLGERLFHEPRLSANDAISCANCHNPSLSFGDGVSIGKGIKNIPLDRHTPHIWNLAWGHAFFWDGRARSLQEQARGPIENPSEMGQPLQVGIEKLRRDAAYRELFAAAFPDTAGLTEENALKALAAFEMTLVSPSTRFDRWIEGDETALTEAEVEGFKLFTGKAGCAVCHSGWRFTDDAFHDIGLPGNDLGRGPIAELPRLNRAFKTPSLRELAWSAPYMHDGSKPTLDDVLRHYEQGIMKRSTLSPDLAQRLSLTDGERDSLIAFLETLSSERPPKPDAALWRSKAVPSDKTVAISALSVDQRKKAFSPARTELKRGETLTILNNDSRPHNVTVFDPRLKLNSGVQEPGEFTTITFNELGTFEVFCGIHPSMRLSVEVK
ncbi:MAG: c-type cytochrome [Hyphomicrobiaceae bacterium]|nr:MAG: c-type cytochrome [Hyphomicrobiaceae bacterium]